MSDLRVALVAEGPTDLVIIEAALRAILPQPFVLNLIQPEPTLPNLGSGWGGVSKWCREANNRMQGRALEDDPTLDFFDLIVLHLDADVADKSYADYGPGVLAKAQHAGLKELPCPMPCPPASDAAEQTGLALLSWLGIGNPGNKSVFCIPSKSTEAWLAAAVFPNNADIMAGLECEMDMEGKLSQLPKRQRIKRSRREYLPHSATLTNHWHDIRRRCSQADKFHRDVETIIQIPAP